ncbi:MAG TPA: DEAD/DEAH box helicase family protein, partial [Gemmatimonadales bacterium]|nr:DEAD/DEAH box helicase family protein [Gemmatimonadales bacterium]
MDRARHLFQKVAQARQTDSRERDAEKAALLLQRTFPAQRDFIEDPSDRKAALCPRQCGKSFAVLVYGLYVALRRPGARVLILARVRRQVKGTYWADLKQFCRDFELGASFREIALECELPNGSTIIFGGADTAEEVDKHRGQRYDLIVIDEGKSYSAELMAEMIREVLEPALLAKRGTLALIGTPGAILAGPFWEITTSQKTREGQYLSRPYAKRRDPEWVSIRAPWSLHRWTQLDNVFCPWIWEGALRLKADHGYGDDDPAWLREYMGHWVPDENLLVYAWSKVVDERCVFKPEDGTDHGLPAGHDWRFILGMDIGYHDDTSFVVGAWSDTYPALVYIHAEKHPHLTVEQIADRAKALEVQFGAFDAR